MSESPCLSLPCQAWRCGAVFCPACKTSHQPPRALAVVKLLQVGKTSHMLSRCNYFYSSGLLAGVGSGRRAADAPGYRDLSPPRPPSLKHSPTARVLWGKKVGSLRSASPPTGELLISLPVKQQLQELKPNGSNSGNRKIPTLSSCRQGRREALRSTARDAAIRPLGFGSLPRWTRCGCAVHPSQ